MGFPDSTIGIVRARLEYHMPLMSPGDGAPNEEPHFLERPIRPTDPWRTISVFAADHTANEESVEILGQSAPPEPTIHRYQYRIQNLIRHTKEDVGKRLSSIDGKVVWTVLYRDPELRLALAAVVDTDVFSVTERFKRLGVRQQRYLNNEVRGEWLWVTQTEFWIETATT